MRGVSSEPLTVPFLHPGSHTGHRDRHAIASCEGFRPRSDLAKIRSTRQVRSDCKTKSGDVMSTAESRARFRVVASHWAPTIVVSALVGLAWFTVRGEGEGAPFPNALLQAEGAVLAALERLGWGGRVFHLRERLSSGEVTGPRRRRRMEQEVADLEARSERSHQRAREMGTLTAGIRRLYGRALMVVARAHRLDRLLNWFIYLLVAGLLVGLVRGGPTVASWADPGVWVAASLPVIAATYRNVVAKQLLNEADSLISGLNESWLLHLYTAEYGLGMVCEKLASTLEEDGLTTIDIDAAKAVLLHVDLAEKSAPEGLWLASLRGRLHLAHAVVAYHRLGLQGETSDSEDLEDNADLCRELATAETLLRRASSRGSDPVAGLALASCLDLSLAKDDVRGREESAGHACSALDLLERLRPNSWDFGFDKTSGVRLAHDWTWDQSFLLRPEDSDLRPEDSDLSARFDFVVDHPRSD